MNRTLPRIAATAALAMVLAVTSLAVSADPRREGQRCTASAVAAGAVWKGTYSGSAPSDIRPRNWSGSRCFPTQAACQAWLNRIAGMYSYSTRASRCGRV